MIGDKQGEMIFSVEDASDNIVAAIQHNDVIQKYECTLDCCVNPVCTCGTVHMNFAPIGQNERNHPMSSYQVDIDLIHRKLDFKDENKVPGENLAFARSLLSNMGDTDFDFLWTLYYAYKNKITQQAPIDTIETDFDFYKVEDSGLMYAYTDVLPYGDPLLVRMKGKSCLIFDQYCLRPKCTCTDVTLEFVSNSESPDESGRSLFAVSVNYKKKKWSAVEGYALPVDVEAARTAIEEQIPGFYKRLLKRHIKLKGIYGHCKKRHFNEQLELPKVGRNDPCPCGSGKKYKKCCMR